MLVSVAIKNNNKAMQGETVKAQNQQSLKQAVFVDPLVKISAFSSTKKGFLQLSLLLICLFLLAFNNTYAKTKSVITNESTNTIKLFLSINANEGLEKAQHFLELGANPNGNQLSYNNPLFTAIAQNQIEVAKLLLTLGANPNQTYPNFKRTALEHVCYELYPTQKRQKINGQKQKDEAIYAWFKLLIDFGADPTKHDKNNVPIVHCLVRHTSSTELFDLLEQYGVDLNEVRKNNKTTGRQHSTLGSSISRKNFKITNYLVNKEIDLALNNYQDVKTMFLYYKTGEAKYKDIAKLPEKYTLLKNAILSSFNKIKNFTKNQTMFDNYLDNYLIYAIKWNEPKLLEQAIIRGANINGRLWHKAQPTALELARKHQHPTLMKIIKHYQNKQKGQSQ